jgi:hypothetical protein
MSGALVLEHLGKLHPVEHVLVLVLAFGPIVLLGLTIWIARRRAEEEPEEGQD